MSDRRQLPTWTVDLNAFKKNWWSNEVTINPSGCSHGYGRVRRRSPRLVVPGLAIGRRATLRFIGMMGRRSPGQRLPFGASVLAWYDQETNGFVVWLLLAIFLAIWTSFHVISNSATVLHDDLLEVFVWSQHPAAGYSKQPPLAGLMAAGWFKIFPPTNWSFALLATANAATALSAVYLIGRRYLASDKRLFVLLLLLLTPFYQFHSHNFSTN